MISDVRHLNFVPDENHLSVTFSAHARPAEFRLTDEQVVLLWEQFGARVAKLARRRYPQPRALDDRDLLIGMMNDAMGSGT